MTIINDIKARLNLLDIAGEYLTLQHAGKNWKASCPFHDDRTPSLFIFPDTQRWKCFGLGCAKSGDLLDLVQQLEKWDFPTTLRHLADRAGLQLQPLTQHQQAQLDLRRLREEVFTTAMTFFQQTLFPPNTYPTYLPSPEGEGLGVRSPETTSPPAPDDNLQHAAGEALHYALSRGWTSSTLLESGLGAFTQDWNGLRSHLHNAGIDLESPAAVALIGFRGDVAGWAHAHAVTPAKAWLDNGKVPAMPPNMLIYPHLDRGRVTYLAGRSLEGKSHWNPPHQLAGPRQPYFNACWNTHNSSHALIVGGQGDALTCAQWSLPALALAGSAIPHHFIPSPNGSGALHPSDTVPHLPIPSPNGSEALHPPGTVPHHPIPSPNDSGALHPSDTVPHLPIPSPNGSGALHPSGTVLHHSIPSGKGPGDRSPSGNDSGHNSHPSRDGSGVGSTDNYLLSSLLHKAKTSQICLALDSDDAGRSASSNLAASLLQAGLKATQLKLLTWPAHDANDCLQSGLTSAAVISLLNDSPTYLHLLIQAALDNPDDSAAQRALFDALAPLDHYELSVNRELVCSSLKLRRQVFDQMLRSTRLELEASLDSQRGPDSRYFVSNGCTFYRTYNSQGAPLLDKLCNFSALILQEVKRDDGQQIDREFLVQAQLNGRSLPDARVRSTEFDRMDWVLREWGASAIIEPGPRRRDQLRAAIQHLSPHIDRRTVYTHTGWRQLDSGPRVYLSGSGALGCDGIQVDLDSDLHLYSLPLHPQDPLAALQASLQFLHLAPFAITVPLWASIWLAPLCEFIRPTFVVWLFGGTGALKSSLAGLLLNHFGPDFDGNQFPANFMDSPGRLEHKAFLAKDSILVIDDYAPQKDPRSAQEYKRLAHHIVRAVGNRAGRGRLTREIKARPSYVPRSLVMVTGEDLPETESLVARLFVVEFTKDSVDKQILSAMQAQRHLYSHAMAAYLAWVNEHWDGYKTAIPAQWRRYRQNAFSEGLHLRLPEAIASLMMGWEMGLRFALSTGVLPSEAYQQLMQVGWLTLLEAGSSMSNRTSEEKPDELYLRTFRELLAQGKICLRQRDGTGLLGGPSDSAEMLGWYDETYVYLLPQVAYTRICRHYRDQGSNFPVREPTLRKSLREAGLLEERHGRLTSSEWLDGHTQRVLILKRSVLE